MGVWPTEQRKFCTKQRKLLKCFKLHKKATNIYTEIRSQENFRDIFPGQMIYVKSISKNSKFS